MLLRSLLLRVVLCLLLVFDGISVAMASTQMATARMEAPRSPAEPERTASVPPCHESAVSAPQVTTSQSGGDADRSGRGGTTDCCASGSCPCTCVQHAFAAIPAGWRVESFASHMHHPGAPDPGHADAFLPQLIRPPIG
ncbi:CopL family metal-binding regulatory protein [Lysobacter sp.]|uniref:CopL family metal-binding regulatory protein n=1 Tax=Lysobacter sp. TaxID=72226 RepID=UPI0039C90EC5